MFEGEASKAKRLERIEEELSGLPEAITAAVIAGDDRKVGQLRRRQEDLQSIIPVLRDQIELESLNADLAEVQAELTGLQDASDMAAEYAEETEIRAEAAKRIAEEAATAAEQARRALESCSTREGNLRGRIQKLSERIQENARAAAGLS